MSTDAIVVLREDHRAVRALFREFERAGERAYAVKGRLITQIIELLTVHSYIENEGMYPDIRELVPGLERHILESLEEHHVAEVLLAELAAMRPEDERFTAKATVLIDYVDRHIDEEENEWFPKVREHVGRNQLRTIGARMLELRKKAPALPAR
ncbi:hemerythrin domain-containing protein [Nocardia sp. NPDC050712]|uniref:hemerythrin domain-containing protein n=1 Tax=Nocardia sp. NPDC050712 TaxID=3155518 RepID=UPI0033CE715C